VRAHRALASADYQYKYLPRPLPTVGPGSGHLSLPPKVTGVPESRGNDLDRLSSEVNSECVKWLYAHDL
jgi:hypothetical protein